ncbi:MAG TPA: ATP-binding protein [Acidobacteriaceae bacterium]|jgi:signal transduction histidine kinase|nr:ATP-binding protein [Acidobacteriaceae bacterium]
MPEGQPRILVVDDREQNRYVLCRVLRQANYQCFEAANGADALAFAATLPDLMILDVTLPDMSGFDVCRQIKRDPRTSQISVLQISASMISSANKARALEAGADGYLIHPIDGAVLVATVRSLLRLRAAEAAARQSAQQWQAAFDALSEGLAVVSADCRLVRWNAAFAAMCGAESALVDGGDAAMLLERLLGTGEPLRDSAAARSRSEFTMGDKTIDLSVNWINPRSRESGLVLVLTDISDRQLAEYAMRTAEKIAATGKLANAIAHEINNPLESLTNLLYLAQGSHSVEAIQSYLSQASQELNRVSHITRQTLSFHRDTHVPTPIEVGSLVAGVVELFEKSAASRRIRIVLDRRPTLAVYGYPGQLSQVFGNLVRNATEAARPDTKVIVRVRRVSRRGSEGTRVTIHDYGSGIPENIQRLMFDPFFTTKELRGSGLGLWVSKSLVLKHKGTIRFRSSTRAGASGTTFEVFLPLGGLMPKNYQNEDV